MSSVIFKMGSGDQSRPFNAVELSKAFNRIEGNYENAKAKADERAGQSFLKYFRKLVAKHNTKNHAGKITIVAAMGMCGVYIDGVSLSSDHRWNGFAHHPNVTPLMQLLFAIEETMDYDWAWTLDGEALN